LPEDCSFQTVASAILLSHPFFFSFLLFVSLLFWPNFSSLIDRIYTLCFCCFPSSLHLPCVWIPCILLSLEVVFVQRCRIAIVTSLWDGHWENAVLLHVDRKLFLHREVETNSWTQ
jgi:hypothetical protein